MIEEYFRITIQTLKRRRLRTALTMLGIFIGIALLVVLISLGQGLRVGIQEEFNKLGADKIFVEPKGVAGAPGTTSAVKLTTSDKEVVEKTKGIVEVGSYLARVVPVKFDDEINYIFLWGISTDPDEQKFMEEVMMIEVEEGRGLKSGDKFKAVLGYSHSVDGKLFDNSVNLRDKIEIEGTKFKAIGFWERIGSPIDDASITLSMDLMRELYDFGDEEHFIIARTAPGEDPAEVAKLVEKRLRKHRGVEKGKEDFKIQTSDQYLESFNQIMNILTSFLVGLAAISLIVGGIGIMTTMYTAVAERTREIGIMKAIGAKNSDILNLFLIESGILGLVGGLIGILIGIGISEIAVYIIKNLAGLDYMVAFFPWYLMLGALTFSFLIGALSGVIPARQASKMKPVDSLRYE